MKKTLLSLSFLSFGIMAFAQDCSKIFISEYVEGWSNNKAIEIYNPTNQTVNLGEYFIARYSNGATSASVNNAIQLQGSIAPGDVYVAVIDKRDPQGTGQEAPVWDSLQARADGFYAPDYNLSNSFYWNGDDAIVLAKGTLPASSTADVTTSTGFQIIDIFGKIGERPTNADGGTTPTGGWSTAFPYATGQGVIVTVDHSLIRKASVKSGVTTPVTFFNPLEFWDSIPAVTYLFDNNGDTIVSGNGNAITFGNWFSLGEHTCDCATLSTPKIVKNIEFSVAPNPTSTGVFKIESTNTVESFEIYNGLGQLIKSGKPNQQIVEVRLPNQAGLYILKAQTSTGSYSKRVIVK